MKSGCVTSDQLYESMSNSQLKIKFWDKFGPKKALNVDLNFFGYRYHLNMLDIIVVYHNMQNE